jgi:hypothetical protein
MGGSNNSLTVGDTFRQQYKASQEDISKSRELMQPGIDWYSAFASGDQSKMESAAAPGLRQIEQQFSAARSSMDDTLPATAGTEAAKQLSGFQEVGAKGAAMYEPYISSFDKLAGAGRDYSALGMNELSASLQAGQVKTAQDTAEKQAIVGALGNFAASSLVSGSPVNTQAGVPSGGGFGNIGGMGSGSFAGMGSALSSTPIAAPMSAP